MDLVLKELLKLDVWGQTEGTGLGTSVHVHPREGSPGPAGPTVWVTIRCRQLSHGSRAGESFMDLDLALSHLTLAPRRLGSGFSVRMMSPQPLTAPLYSHTNP